MQLWESCSDILEHWAKVLPGQVASLSQGWITHPFMNYKIKTFENIRTFKKYDKNN